MVKTPDKFLDVRVHDLELTPGLTGLCAGYENNKWRSGQFASHLIEWLPDFALDYTEKKGIGSHNAVAFLAKAARTVYTSEKYKKRGELGEILLHIAIRQVFKTIPAISKYFFKDSPNDTIKGFDAVHVICDEKTLELWLGEVKFYRDISGAIKNVIQELEIDLRRDYLRNEFALITNKIDDNWPHAQRLKKLLNRNVSLDDIFDAMCIPVCLTYESNVIRSHRAVTEEFKEAFAKEIYGYYSDFTKKDLPSQVRIHLFLIPLEEKDNLVKDFDDRLKKCQAILN